MPRDLEIASREWLGKRFWEGLGGKYYVLESDMVSVQVFSFAMGSVKALAIHKRMSLALFQ